MVRPQLSPTLCYYRQADVRYNNSQNSPNQARQKGAQSNHCGVLHGVWPGNQQHSPCLEEGVSSTLNVLDEPAAPLNFPVGAPYQTERRANSNLQVKRRSTCAHRTPNLTTA